MAQVMIEMTEEQIEVLAARSGAPFGTSRSETGGVVEFFGDDASRFVLRCVGTVLELEQAQSNGATFLVRNDRGVVRKLDVNVGRDGEPLVANLNNGFLNFPWFG